MGVRLQHLFICLILGGFGSAAQPPVKCAYKTGEADFLPRIGCRGDFDYLKGKPLSEKFGKAESVKLVYEIGKGKIYFLNSKKYPFHYRFCSAVLNEEDDIPTFNAKNYKVGPLREYVLLNINYYPTADVFALELMPEDDAKATTINEIYKKIVSLSYFAPRIKLMISTPEMETKFSAIPGLPLVKAEDIYQGRKYVSLNKGKTFGYLRRVDIKEFANTKYDRHDIVILNGLPNDLPVVSGVITTPFQTPLCHISLLCYNRGTPNSTYRSAWTDPKVQALVNRLVFYEVTADTFTLRTASEAEAKAFWDKTENRKPIVLRIDTSLKQLADLSKMQFSNVSLVGGKAANFAELLKVRIDRKPLPLPEGSFAIPFWFYCRHLENNRINVLLDSIIGNQAVLNNPALLSQQLKIVRERIEAAPLDPTLVKLVSSKLRSLPAFTHFRFRSSTNAEDVKGFNGAGLYESKTGSLTDAAKPFEKAIRAVWASLWDERAFAERQYFKIDQRSVAMGILVHRAFGEELSNGVAVTRHMYRPDYPSFTINAQVGETSVVTPPENVSCDEAIVSLGEVTGSKDISIEYIMRSSLSKDKPVLTNAQVKLLCRYLTAIKEHYYYKVDRTARKEKFWNYGMDVEFKVDALTGNLYIKQARTL
jgi:hypothetical protein